MNYKVEATKQCDVRMDILRIQDTKEDFEKHVLLSIGTLSTLLNMHLIAYSQVDFYMNIIKSIRLGKGY